jgi:hypothetical protein
MFFVSGVFAMLTVLGTVSALEAFRPTKLRYGVLLYNSCNTVSYGNFKLQFGYRIRISRDREPVKQKDTDPWRVPP